MPTNKKNDKGAGGKAKGKDDGKGKAESGAAAGGKLKPATSINARHILVCSHYPMAFEFKIDEHGSARNTPRKKRHWESYAME